MIIPRDMQDKSLSRLFRTLKGRFGLENMRSVVFEVGMWVDSESRKARSHPVNRLAEPQSLHM